MEGGCRRGRAKGRDGSPHQTLPDAHTHTHTFHVLHTRRRPDTGQLVRPPVASSHSTRLPRVLTDTGAKEKDTHAHSRKHPHTHSHALVEFPERCIADDGQRGSVHLSVASVVLQTLLIKGLNDTLSNYKTIINDTLISCHDLPGSGMYSLAPAAFLTRADRFSGSLSAIEP